MDADELTALARSAGTGNLDAAARFIRATQAEVWRLCAALGVRGEADDLTQETYLRAFQALPRFAGLASARTWLLAIARRVCVDSLRSQRRRPRLDPGRTLLDVQPATPDIGEGVAIRGLIRDLDPTRREAFVLTQSLGLTYAEAAEVCGCPIGTIRSRVARARDDLATWLSAEEKTGSA